MSDIVRFKQAPIEQVKELEQRIVDFLPGGKDVPHEVRMALAQISIAHGLDPFLHEVWPIPKKDRDGRVIGWDMFIGISGWRNAAHRSEEYWGRRFEKVNDEDRQQLGASANDVVSKCIVMRRKTGQHPCEYDGYGVAKAGEFSKMNKFQLARLRAERDAMKAAFPISAPFGVSLKAVDDDGDVINGDHGPSLSEFSQYDTSEKSGEVSDGEYSVNGLTELHTGGRVATDDLPDGSAEKKESGEQSDKTKEKKTSWRQASIKTQKYAAMIVQLKDSTSYYSDPKTGAVNSYHVLKSAAKIGYEEITNDNIDSVLRDLIQHAKEQETKPAA